MQQKELRTRFITAAIRAQGYRSLPNGHSDYGLAVGYDYRPWDGALVTALLEDSGIDGHPWNSTASALAHYTRAGRLRKTPKPGDIAVFAYSVTDDGQPHVGIVTDTSRHGYDGAVKVVEGMVSSGSARETDTPNGVFERIRYAPDFAGFVRLKFRVSAPDPVMPDGRPALRAVSLTSRLDISLIQSALAATVGLRNANRGKLDRQSQSAYAEWQRQCGRYGADATGTPDTDTLRRLGERTGLFTVRD